MKIGTTGAGDAGEPGGVGTSAELTRTAVCAALPAVSAAAPKDRFPRGRWTVFRNPFSNVPKASAAPLRVPVQGELSLDLVKPVRNDLRDSDLVVVPGRPGPEPEAGAAAVAAVTPGDGSPTAEVAPVWSRIKTQLFGVGKR